jgi:hypothetical protein
MPLVGVIFRCWYAFKLNSQVLVEIVLESCKNLATLTTSTEQLFHEIGALTQRRIVMWQKFSTSCLITAVVCLFLTDSLAHGADAVIHWNNVLLNSVRTDRTPPPAASRKMAIVHIAIYDAVNSITQSHTPYLFFTPMSPDLPQEAAIASAAHTTLSALFPQFQLIYDMELADALSQIPDGPNKNAAVVLGQEAASAILAG